MVNPETLETMDTQDTRRKQNKKKETKQDRKQLSTRNPPSHTHSQIKQSEEENLNTRNQNKQTKK